MTLTYFRVMRDALLWQRKNHVMKRRKSALLNKAEWAVGEVEFTYKSYLQKKNDVGKRLCWKQKLNGPSAHREIAGLSGRNFSVCV